MLDLIKPLIVVLVCASAVFIVGRPIWLKFMTPEDFARRRNVWLALTVVAFLAPNFWVYVIVAVPVLCWAALRDRSPLAVYLMMLHLIPPVSFTIPFPGINQLFPLNQYRLLALVILIPFVVRVLRERQGQFRFGPVEFFMLAYSLICFVPLLPYETYTNTLRRSLLLVLDSLLIYYAFSRGVRSAEGLSGVLTGLLMGLALMAPVALIEYGKTWQIYRAMTDNFGYVEIAFSFLTRGDVLRARVAAGGPLTLGYMMALGLTVWLLVGARLSKAYFMLGLGVLSAGLLATYSRGPWLAGLVGVCLALAVLMRSIRWPLQALAWGVFALTMVLISPVGRDVMDLLPFADVDSENVIYRQRLLDTSWRIAIQTPWFGNLSALNQMESLRQGQGIIDLVNVYASVAVFRGFLGLACFVALLLYAVWAARACARHCRRVGDEAAARVYLALQFMVIVTLNQMSNLSFVASLEIMTWVLVGLGSACALQMHGLRAPQAGGLQRRTGRPAYA